MAGETTRLTIELELLLRNLNRTLRGLGQVEERLRRISSVRIDAATTQRQGVAAQRLANQQQRLGIQTQELANRQERARQTAERLTLSSQRLSQTQQRVTAAANRQADAHVRVFRAIQQGAPELDRHVLTFRSMQRAFSQAPQLDRHVRAFRALERATARAPQLDAHVRAFRALQRATAEAPQLDAHVRAFRRLQEASQQLNRNFTSLGNSLRSIGQGLASVGATLTFSVTAPLVALGASIVDAAVRLDSLQRGLKTIAGSSQEAAVQLERLTQLAKLPGIGFEEAIQGSIRLQAVGFSAAEAERALKQFSNAIALTGGGREELANITVQLGQMAAQSRVLAQDLKPIISSAPAVAVALREAFGTVRSEELQELGISSQEFISTLVRQLETLPRAAAGARNSFENFRDELFRAAATVGTTILPALTRLAEVAGPIITTLANAFAALPVPLQVIGVGFVALVAALGPASFAISVLVTGVGRLLVGFGQLNATGILPTIANLRALTAGTLGAAAAQRTLATTTALVAGGVGVLLTALATVITGFAAYKAFQKDSVTLAKEQVDALDDQIKGLEEQLRFVNGLGEAVERTANEEERLLQIYEGLNRAAKIRITGIEDEETRLAALAEEIRKVILLREQERIQAAASIVGELANNLVRLEANQKERDAIAARIQANNALIETLEREQRISVQSTRALAERGITANTVEGAIGALKTESENLSDAQDALITAGKELNDTAKDEVEIIRALEKQTGLTARGLLVVARNMGGFRGDVAAMIPVLEAYIKKTSEATNATDEFNRSLSENERQLNKAGKEAEEEQKRRNALISSSAALAREASNSFVGALKFMRAFIAANPELRAALTREAQIAGKSFDEFVQESLNKAFGRSGTSRSERGLRNARQQLADALADVALAQKDREVEIEKDRNEELLRAAEVGQRLRIISHREFLELRAQLTADSIDREIGQQKELVAATRKRQSELLGEARRPGLQADERARRQAQAAQKEEEAIKAETKLTLLQRQRDRITTELQQTLRETQQQQITDVAQLEIRYAELQGRIEDALKAATVEEFREALNQLSREQKFLNREINKTNKLRQPERFAELQASRERNQRQIESILNIIRQRDALAELAATERLIENAKERQRQLEEDLTFQVQFRGLSEAEAIKRRLAGEQKLQDALIQQAEAIAQLRQNFIDLGLTPPPELQKFLDTLATEILGLAELPFTEQFRLAEEKFNQINDERLRRIADVERAVNNRNIAEAEGLLLIRRINGQYVGDLERQLELLKQIAVDSKDASLQRQAQSAEESVKDASDRLADFDKQLRSTGIDALRSGFIDFFQSLRDNTVSAQEKLLNLIDSVVARINEVIAENLFDELMKSIFGDGTESTGGGIIASLKRLFGLGGNDESQLSEGGLGAQLVQSQTALQTGAAAAAATLTTAATAAAATETASATGFAAAITAAAAGFTAAVTAAGVAFATAVAGAGLSQGVSAGLTSSSGIGSFAVGNMVPARQGGVLARIAEGGYPEAVLTADPKHAARQLEILRRFLRHTRGLGGRVREFAEGAFISPHEAQSMMFGGLAGPNIPSGDVGQLAIASTPSTMRLRQVLVDQRSYRDWVTSSEGEEVLVDFLYKHQPVIRKIGGR